MPVANVFHEPHGTYPGADPWGLYDELIEGIPQGIEVLDYCLGVNWSCVHAACGGGVSYTVSGGAHRGRGEDLRGRDLREVAVLAKSWNFAEATLGVAAMNAYYSQPERELMATAQYEQPTDKYHAKEAFALQKPRIEAMDGSANVVVIGHFPNVSDIAKYANLVVLERNASSDIDTPDPACEYVIPGADFLFMTGVTLMNKTAPRILELASGVETTMVGPSALPARALFDRGVDTIAGRIVVDPEKTLFACKTGNRFGDALKMYDLENPASLS